MFDQLTRFAADWRRSRARRRTRLILSQLPPELPRAVGYPSDDILPSLRGVFLAARGRKGGGAGKGVDLGWRRVS